MILSHLPCLSGKSLICLIIYSQFLPICFQKEQTEKSLKIANDSPSMKLASSVVRTSATLPCVCLIFVNI